jgi:hypothetical protein
MNEHTGVPLGDVRTGLDMALKKKIPAPVIN